ncbi:MAG: Ap4A phosphorylase II [Candidatus Thiodiazotropha sp.]|nr:phosphorylase [Candidatus Thiodiazotropha sp. (ex Lucina pensylvanica)]MBT3064986.1 phosphorylase [Candidatus Thiodiazotropha sp. (ex Lucina pensylvanica)]MBV2095551.1 phosphorylase [Candidatus Thiodiazotropha sp. (ex Codakia orbicularis)]PUB72645.1 MAG: phosphorylase [gamma proteobacterium symbiont of Ctena orbiculata]PUB78134.1 MAG: phosphorylase [gamma proteobacterium symbiont of Ctena orbiculata]
MTTRLETGMLWRQLCSRTESAIASGALHSIATDYHRLRQDGMEFVVRVALNLERKAREKRRQTAASSDLPFNPFLPPEPDLTVADISPTHLSVLNKFNVVEHHLLIVTRDYQDQERLLTLEDFEALWLCMAEYPSLGFYNGGETAGASQRHKHLQLVPLPLYQGQSSIPFQPLFASAPGTKGMQSLKQLPFLHCWAPLPDSITDDLSSAAKRILSLYLQMLGAVGIETVKRPLGDYQAAPYNLLLTREWMLLVPRSQEYCETISVNALGYVGSLFVRQRSELETLTRIGPMNLLRAVSLPNS